VLYHVTTFEAERNKGRAQKLLRTTIWKEKEKLLMMTQNHPETDRGI
jgi:hypothetical protein